MASRSAQTVDTLRRSEFVRLFTLDNGGLRLVIEPPLPSLELPPGHAREAEIRALAQIEDDDDFEEAAIAAVGKKK